MGVLTAISLICVLRLIGVQGSPPPLSFASRVRREFKTLLRHSVHLASDGSAGATTTSHPRLVFNEGVHTSIFAEVCKRWIVVGVGRVFWLVISGLLSL